MLSKLEKFLTSLGTIANISTLLGLLGTVTGNISAFGVLGAGASMGNPALLAGSIAEAYYGIDKNLIKIAITGSYGKTITVGVKHTIADDTGQIPCEVLCRVRPVHIFCIEKSKRKTHNINPF